MEKNYSQENLIMQEEDFFNQNNEDLMDPGLIKSMQGNIQDSATKYGDDYGDDDDDSNNEPEPDEYNDDQDMVE